MRLRATALAAGIAMLALAGTATATTPNTAAPSAPGFTTLGDVWQTVLETPAPDNPFTPGGNPCVDVGGVVAPFGGFSPTLTCTVKQGTRLFITAWTSECSTLEAPPYFGSNPRELRACARAVDAGITSTNVTLDGRPVLVTETESRLMRLNLPADNIFSAPAGTGPLSVAHGWVAHFLQPLRPGTHTITLHAEGTYPNVTLPFNNTTTIIVQPRR